MNQIKNDKHDSLIMRSSFIDLSINVSSIIFKWPIWLRCCVFDKDKLEGANKYTGPHFGQRAGKDKQEKGKANDVEVADSQPNN